MRGVGFRLVEPPGVDGRRVAAADRAPPPAPQLPVDHRLRAARARDPARLRVRAVRAAPARRARCSTTRSRSRSGPRTRSRTAIRPGSSRWSTTTSATRVAGSSWSAKDGDAARRLGSAREPGRGTSRAVPSSEPRCGAGRRAAPGTRTPWTRRCSTSRSRSSMRTRRSARCASRTRRRSSTRASAGPGSSLAGVGAIILGIVFLVSLRLARQVTKPLDELERAAAGSDSGDLDAARAGPRRPAGDPRARRVVQPHRRAARGARRVAAGVRRRRVAPAADTARRVAAAAREPRGRARRDAGPAQDDVGGALDEVARLSRLVDGLLELRAPSAAPAAPAPIELGPVVDGRVEAWSALAAERDVELVGEVERRPRGELDARAGSSRCSTTSSRTRSRSSPPDSAVRVPRSPRRAGSSSRSLDAGPGHERRSSGPGPSTASGARPAPIATVARASGSRSCSGWSTADGGIGRRSTSRPGGGLAARVRAPAGCGQPA